MTNIESITLEAELVGEDATRDIAKAVSARHSQVRHEAAPAASGRNAC